jgi:hypothetical protein
MHGDGVVEDVLEEESLVCMTKEAMKDEGRE